jgi:hypothetical protein
MKVCERCGDEIATKDGDNLCAKCEAQPVRKTKRRRSERDAVMRSLGLVKVKGALGGTYWE